MNLVGIFMNLVILNRPEGEENTICQALKRGGVRAHRVGRVFRYGEKVRLNY